MNDDPAIYKILALSHILVWGSFLIRYVYRLVRNGHLGRPKALILTLAGAVLAIGVAMVLYGITNVLRQFLGLDYFGRDAVRIIASTAILAAGVIFHIVLSKDAPTRK